jgi:hypothetical protein
MAIAVRTDDQLPPLSLALVRCQPELLDADPPGRFSEVVSPCRKAQAARARGVTGGPQQVAAVQASSPAGSCSFGNGRSVINLWTCGWDLAKFR